MTRPRLRGLSFSSLSMYSSASYSSRVELLRTPIFPTPTRTASMISTSSADSVRRTTMRSPSRATLTRNSRDLVAPDPVQIRRCHAKRSACGLPNVGGVGCDNGHSRILVAYGEPGHDALRHAARCGHRRMMSRRGSRCSDGAIRRGSLGASELRQHQPIDVSPMT